MIAGSDQGRTAPALSGPDSPDDDPDCLAHTSFGALSRQFSTVAGGFAV